MSIRPVKHMSMSTPTMEGAGVHLRRAFGFGETEMFDPFLLFDDFRGDVPSDYLAGFPWHPHRGIETITYVLTGTVEHGDSLGNTGRLGAGDVQWMTAGRGILHQEMPQGDAAGRMHGFQLWANLPGSQKMTAPRYQDIQGADIPTVGDDDGTLIRVVCGSFWGTTGPVDGLAANPMYLDVFVPPGVTKRLPVDTRRSAFAYIFEGSARFDDVSDPRGVLTDPLVGSDAPIFDDDLAVYSMAGNRSLLVFDRGDEVVVRAGDEGVRFLLVAGQPIQEPVAWYGPIVMNTKAELREAYSQLKSGTFLEQA